MNKRARSPTLRGDLIRCAVQLEGETQRQRRLARRLFPAVIPGEPGTGVIAQSRHVPSRDSLFRAVVLDYSVQATIKAVLERLQHLAGRVELERTRARQQNRPVEAHADGLLRHLLDRESEITFAHGVGLPGLLDNPERLWPHAIQRDSPRQFRGHLVNLSLARLRRD